MQPLGYRACFCGNLDCLRHTWANREIQRIQQIMLEQKIAMKLWNEAQAQFARVLQSNSETQFRRQAGVQTLLNGRITGQLWAQASWMMTLWSTGQKH